MIVQVPEGAQPVPREPQWDEHERLIAAYADVITTVAAHARRDTRLAAGEVLILDNYRCLHGLRCKSQDAYGHRSAQLIKCAPKELSSKSVIGKA